MSTQYTIVGKLVFPERIRSRAIARRSCGRRPLPRSAGSIQGAAAPRASRRGRPGPPHGGPEWRRHDGLFPRGARRGLRTERSRPPPRRGARSSPRRCVRERCGARGQGRNLTRQHRRSELRLGAKGVRFESCDESRQGFLEGMDVIDESMRRAGLDPATGKPLASRAPAKKPPAKKPAAKKPAAKKPAAKKRSRVSS